MGFLRKLFGRGAPKAAPVEQPNRASVAEAPKAAVEPRPVQKSALATGGEASSKPAPQDGVNIWDFEGGEESAPKAPKPAIAAPTDDMPPVPSPGATKADPSGRPQPRSNPSKSARGRRNKTRIIGFESPNSDVVSLFDAGAGDGAPEKSLTSPAGLVAPGSEEVPPIPAPSGDLAPPAPAHALDSAELPQGWLVVTEGPGRGHSFVLTAGMNTIGRAEGAEVALSFGDQEIAEKNHASLIFEDGAFHLKKGEGALSRNGKPVMTRARLDHGDSLTLGSTHLRLVALCGTDFGWDTTGAKETDNAATA